MPLQPGKCQIAHTFALTKILANTPTVPEKTQATRAFTAPRGAPGNALFCGSGKSQAAYAFAVPKKNIGSKTCTPMPQSGYLPANPYDYSYPQ